VEKVKEPVKIKELVKVKETVNNYEFVNKDQKEVENKSYCRIFLRT